MTDAITAAVVKKDKSLVVKPAMVSPFLRLFVNALIVRPEFDSQSKRKLTSLKDNFGSVCVLDEKVLKRVCKQLPIVDSVMANATRKSSKLLKKSDGKPTGAVNVPKLEDAEDAGTKRKEGTTIIFTEGDSAKALV